MVDEASTDGEAKVFLKYVVAVCVRFCVLLHKGETGRAVFPNNQMLNTSFNSLFPMIILSFFHITVVAREDLFKKTKGTGHFCKGT